jgi:hypothetical protein
MVTVLKKGTSVEMKREQLKAISKKKSKGINAFKYLGILKKKIDPLKFQKQLESGEMGDYVLNRNLYNAIYEKSNLIANSAIIENYYDSLSLKAIGQLQQVANSYSDNINELLALTTAWQTNDSVMRSNVNQIQYNAHLLNNGSLTTNDSNTLANSNEALKQQIQALAESNENLANSAKWYHQNNANTALNKNAIITTNDNYEANQKTVHQIYARTIATGNADFTPTEITVLYNIAQQCLSYGGPAVLEAQALYKLIDPTLIFENVPCYMGGNRWGFDDEKVVENVDILVYPNPVNEQINIYLQANILNGHYDITITSIFGKKVYSIKDADCKAGLISIATPNLSNGLYFLSILSADKSLNQTVKIEVIK